MYIVQDKNTKEIIHKNPAPLSQKLTDEEIYFKFDSKKMAIGKIEGDLPEHFKIDKDGFINELTLQELVDTGLISLQEHEKVENNEIVEKTLAEKVVAGLVETKPNQKVVGNDIVEKSLQEQLDEKLISLSDIKVQKITEFSTLSLLLRNNFLPDYKILNALLGLYDDKKIDDYKSTIEEFRGEFRRLEAEVTKSKTLKVIEAIKANFPGKIVTSKKSPAAKKKASESMVKKKS